MESEIQTIDNLVTGSKAPKYAVYTKAEH